MTLNPKQERFCQEYIIDLNGKQAAIRAGYSERTAEVQASQLLTKLKVKEKIAELQKKTSDKLELTAEKVLRDIENLRNKAEADNQLSVALKASELQGKHLKLFTEKIEHDIPEPVTTIIKNYSGKKS